MFIHSGNCVCDCSGIPHVRAAPFNNRAGLGSTNYDKRDLRINLTINLAAAGRLRAICAQKPFESSG